MDFNSSQSTGEPSANMATVLQPDEYKIVVIGALGVGKTSLMLKFVHNTFEDRISRFVSEEKKTVTVKDSKTGKEREIMLDLWDTAGEGRGEGKQWYDIGRGWGGEGG